MPPDTPPGSPFPGDQDADRTVAYPTPDSPGTSAGRGSRRRRGWIVPIIAALVVAVVGGGVWAVSRLSGGGSQPQDVLPGNAIAYIRLDLDPAANQKLALFQIAQRFSATKPAFSGDDPKKALFETLKPGLFSLSTLDYATDVEPWLGDRIGVAVLPSRGAGDPGVAVAVQVTDESAAREAITKVRVGEKPSGLAFRDGYAIMASSQQKADEYAAATPLASNARFGEDLKTLGEPGVLSVWADLDKVTSMAQRSITSASADTPARESTRGARLSAALRFDGDYAELAGVVRGAGAAMGARPVKIGELPASTVAALSVSGLGEQIERQWPQIEKAATASPDGKAFKRFRTQAWQMYRLSLPNDIVTLLGTSLTVALDERGIDAGRPLMGAVAATDPAQAQTAMRKLGWLVTDMGVPMNPYTSTGDGTFAAASTQRYADSLTARGLTGTTGTISTTGAKLGDSETFKLAVPDAGNATSVVYADLDKCEKLYLNQLQGEERADVEALRAVGLSAKRTGGDTTFAVRVVVD